MATDTKISDLGGSSLPNDNDLFLIAREDTANYKIEFSQLSKVSAEKAGVVFKTGDQSIEGIKDYTDGLRVSGRSVVTGTAGLADNVVLLTSDQTVLGTKNFSEGLQLMGAPVLTGYSTILGSDISNYAVMVTGDQNAISGKKNFVGDLYLSGNSVLTGINSSDLNAVLLTSDQEVRGAKTLLDSLYISGGILSKDAQNSMVLTDGSDISLYEKPGALSLAFKSGVYVTGGNGTDPANLYVEGKVIAQTLESLENIQGVEGATIWTDGRNPDLFNPPNRSLTLAFESGIYITGAYGADADLRVNGRIVADSIEFLEDIQGISGSTVFTDGRSPDLFNAPDKSFAMAFESGAYVTGSNFYVDGTGYFKSIVKIDGAGDIVQQSTSREYCHVFWRDNQSVSTDIFIPLHPGEGNLMDIAGNVYDHLMHVMIAPHEGKIKKIDIRGRPDTTNSNYSSPYFGKLGNTYFKVYRAQDGDESHDITSYDLMETSVTKSVENNTNQSFDFSESTHFNAGELFVLVCNRQIPGGSPCDAFVNITVEIEYNLT